MGVFACQTCLRNNESSNQMDVRVRDNLLTSILFTFHNYQAVCKCEVIDSCSLRKGYTINSIESEILAVINLHKPNWDDTQTGLLFYTCLCVFGWQILKFVLVVNAGMTHCFTV